MSCIKISAYSTISNHYQIVSNMIAGNQEKLLNVFRWNLEPGFQHSANVVVYDAFGRANIRMVSIMQKHGIVGVAILVIFIFLVLHASRFAKIHTVKDKLLIEK